MGNSSFVGDDTGDDICLENESLYIGKEEGFSPSKSVLSSNISETASEADDEEGVLIEGNNDDRDLDDSLNGGGNGWDDGWGDDDPMLDDDARQSNVEDTVDTATGIVGEEDAKSRRKLNVSSPPTQNVSNVNGGNNESTSSVPSEETIETTTPTKQLLPIDIASTKTPPPPSSNKARQQQPPPPNSVHSTNSSQHDYIPSSLKQILSEQEDELSQLLTSIDALSSTPARIAKDVTDGMLNEDDLDEGLVDVVDMRNVSGGLRYGVGSSRGGSTTPGGGLSPVKKRLVMDNNTGIDGSSTPMMDRKLEPLAEYEEEEDVVDKQNDDVANDAVTEEANLSRETADVGAEKKLPSAPASAASLPQSPAADKTTLPPTDALEMKLPSTVDATELNESTTAKDATSTPPLQRPEPVTSPPIKSPWLSWLSSSNSSPTANNNSLQTPSPQQQHQQEVEKEIVSRLLHPNDETANDEKATVVLQSSSDETATATPKCQVEEAKLLSPSKDKVGDEEQVTNVPVEPSLETFAATPPATTYQEDKDAKDGKQQLEDVMLTTSKSAEDNMVSLPDGQAEDNDSVDLEEDGIPDSIQQLFRDADSQLQNVLMSPVPTTSTTEHHDADGVGTFCEDYIQPDSSEALPLSSEEEGEERRRLAEAAAQAELDRLEEERILEHERTVAKQQQLEEDARLEAERIEQERLEEAERVEQQREKEEEDKRAEAKRAEAERVRLIAERIEEERLEAERVEQQRRKEEEDARLLAEAKRADAERANKERLERERLDAEQKRALEESRQKEEETRLLAKAECVEKETTAAAELPEHNVADSFSSTINGDKTSHDMRDMSNDDTFDTAMCSLGGIEKALDHFFDANDEVDDVGTKMDTGQGENNGGDVVSELNESNNIQHVNNHTPNEDLSKSFEYNNVMEAVEEKKVDGDIDILDRVGSYMNKISGGCTMQDDANSMDVEKSVGVAPVEDKCSPSNDEEMPVESQPPEDDAVIPTINGDDSRPSTGSASTEQAISGVLDESMMNESMFMPSESLLLMLYPHLISMLCVPNPNYHLGTNTDASSNSPESKESPPIIEPLITMSEDESDSEEDDDIEAFFPNRDLSVKPKATASAVDKPKKSTTVDSTSLNDKSKVVEETKAIAPRHSKPASASNQARASSASSNVTSRVKRASSDREPSTKPSSPSDEKQARRISSATLKRRERANNGLFSPPSTMKPAKKRSKSIVQVSSATTTTRRANNRSMKSPPSSLKPARKRSKPIVSATTNALPPANPSSTIRQMRGDPSKSKVVIRGKENNKVERIAKGKPNDKVSSTNSMKQSLVSMTKIRRQSESNLRAPDKGTNPKKTVNMDRIARLANPTRHSMARPPAATSSPARSIKKQATGPPSLLTRPPAARSTVKSTAELEEEEMRRIKPFKAKKICGSTSVPSRYKTATKRGPSPPTPVAPSSSKPKRSTSTAMPRQSSLYKPTPVRKRVSTFGESVQHYLNHGLRSSVPSPKRDVKLTTPKPPSVAFLQRQTMSHSNVKSSEELELEECGKQFKARNYSTITHGRRTTMSYTPSTLSSEQMEMEECQKQFKARPLPGFGKRTQSSHRRETPQQPQREKSRTLTTPSPFRLHTNLLPSKPPPISTDDIELQKKFRALPLPNASSTRCNGTSNTPFHIRAQQQYEMARNRQATRPYEEEATTFKAKPLPKTTYKPQTIEKPTKAQVTQPRPPRLSLMCRAEERKLFDQHADELRRADNAMKELREQQQREYEEQEIRRKRRTYADDEDDPGFCFRARQITIEYTDR